MRLVGTETIANDCVAVRLRMINRVVSGIYDDALRPFGLRVSQMNILVVVSLLGEAARPSEICEMLYLDASTLSRNVDRMNARGWLMALPCEDARSHVLKVTPSGSRLLEQAAPAWERAQADVRLLLGEDGVTGIETMADALWA